MSSAKAALESDAKVLAFEAGRKHKVRVNTISAGQFMTWLECFYNRIFASAGDQSNSSEKGNTNGGSHLHDVLDDDLIEAMKAESNEKFPEIHLPLNRSMLKAFQSMDKELNLHPSIDCFCSGSTAVSLVRQVFVYSMAL